MKKHRILPFLLSAPLSLAFVSIAHAAGTLPADGIGSYLLQIIYFIDRYLVPLIFALAFIVFLWGVYSTFIAGGANEEKRAEGQKLVAYGIIGFFLMVSVWGIVNVLLNSTGFNASSRPTLPTFGAPASGAGTSATAQSCKDALDCNGAACINGTCDYTGTATLNSNTSQSPLDQVNGLY